MKKNIKAPYLPYDKIRVIANDFLERYNPSHTIPVPIEHIAENEFNINIIPVNHLRYAFGIDAWISNDFSEICIDSNIYEENDNRYNFSIAHEIGHVVLHKEIFNEICFTSIDDWVVMMRDGFNSDEYSWIETHAYCFAGLVLVPDTLLKKEYEAVIKKVISMGYKDVRSPMFCEYVSNHLQKIFSVSSQVISKRLKYDGITDE